MSLITGTSSYFSQMGAAIESYILWPTTFTVVNRNINNDNRTWINGPMLKCEKPTFWQNVVVFFAIKRFGEVKYRNSRML